MTTPQSIGAFTPSTQKAMPPSVPCAAATRMLPLTVARMTVVNSLEQPLLRPRLERDRGADVARHADAVAQQEEQQVHGDAEADDQVDRLAADVDGAAGEGLRCAWSGRR